MYFSRLKFISSQSLKPQFSDGAPCLASKAMRHAAGAHSTIDDRCYKEVVPPGPGSGLINR